MKKQSVKETLMPFAWLGTYATGFAVAVWFSPPLLWSALAACTLSLCIILFVAGRDVSQPSGQLVPLGGALLLALITWIAVLLVPVGAMDTSIAARAVAVIAAATLLMPVIAFGEMLFSILALQLVSRAQGRSVLGGELRLIAFIDRKFGGLLGSVNR